MSELPTPVTVTDALLVALTREVQGLRADLTAARGGEPPSPEKTGAVPLSEPARRPRKASPPLHDDTPRRG